MISVTLQQSKETLGNFAMDLSISASEDLHLFYPYSGIITVHMDFQQSKFYLGKIT